MLLVVRNVSPKVWVLLGDNRRLVYPATERNMRLLVKFCLGNKANRYTISGLSRGVGIERKQVLEAVWILSVRVNRSDRLFRFVGMPISTKDGTRFMQFVEFFRDVAESKLSSSRSP